MVQWFGKPRHSPIGVDVGSCAVKLLQFDRERRQVTAAARCDLPADPAERTDERVAAALARAREGRTFRGREAVFCLGAGDLFVQNIRVPQAAGDELRKAVCAEASGRLPYRADEAEIRFVEAGDVRQGDAVRREIILLACHRPTVARIIGLAERAGLVPVGIDVEPAALLRSFARQFRRDNDQERRMMFVSVGATCTRVVIARGVDAMFVKYLDLGGRRLDEALAQHLRMPLDEAAVLRRHSGDRRADQRDPEVARSVQDAARPVFDRLASELAMCVRYDSVTFRGQPLAQVVLGGGEASDALAEWLAARLGLPCEVGNPLRAFEQVPALGRTAQWDVAAGLALREVN
jgi:type IV pilus assembly protein PilM